MADPVAQLHQVLTTCGITTQVDHDRIINVEGFNSIDNLGILCKDHDVDEMVKQMAAHTQADGWVIQGTAALMQLKALAIWVRDKQKLNMEINPDDLMVEEIVMTQTRMAIVEELKEKGDPSVKEIGKFDLDYFKTFDDAFVNLLACSTGVSGEPLRYIIWDEQAPDDFANNEEHWMYDIPLTGPAYDKDNASVYHKLKVAVSPEFSRISLDQRIWSCWRWQGCLPHLDGPLQWSSQIE